MPEEIVSLREQIQKFASLLEETLDIRKLKTIAEAAEPLNWKEDPMHVQRLEDAGSGKLRIGVAMDAAFSSLSLFIPSFLLFSLLSSHPMF